mmetsp:Transcript_550/g.1994  ORF Transcript_550/g.1994 Transcript_550/m.1994 type:complete len:588 (-) Transcript_550:137-1900(-)
MWSVSGLRCSARALCRSCGRRFSSSGGARGAFGAPVALLVAASATALLYRQSSSEEEPQTEAVAPNGDDVQPHKLARYNTERPKHKHYKYVILGAGTTAHAAIEAIMSQDPGADLLLVSEEASLPHDDFFSAKQGAQMPMELLATWNEWRRHVTARLETEPDAISTAPITVLLHKRLVRLDVENKQLLLDEAGSDTISFDRCLLATAGQPRPFYILDSRTMDYKIRDRINSLSTLQDFEMLAHIEDKIGSDGRVCIIGGGFLGTEIALALQDENRRDFSPLCLGKPALKVTQVFAEENPLAKTLPRYFAEEVGLRLRRVGVELLPNHIATEVREIIVEDPPPGEDDEGADQDEYLSHEVLQITAVGKSRQRLEADYIVLASTHCDPVTHIAQASNLEIDAGNGGIVVNSMMEAVNGVYAAGSCASYYDLGLGRRRVDRFDHAVNSGLLAGINMAAAENPGSGQKNPQLYTHQPAFHANLNLVGLNMIGIGTVDSRLRNVGLWVNGNHLHPQTKWDDGNPSLNRGAVYYFEKDKVVGVLLVNCSFLVGRARDALRLGASGMNQPWDVLKRQVPLAPEEWLEERWQEAN